MRNSRLTQKKYFFPTRKIVISTLSRKNVPIVQCLQLFNLTRNHDSALPIWQPGQRRKTCTPVDNHRTTKPTAAESLAKKSKRVVSTTTATGHRHMYIKRC